MRTFSSLAAVATLSAIPASPVVADERAAGPVIVELYTSEGCGGCMDANDFAAELTGEAGVLVLTFGVDYWDFLGWEDSTARPEFFSRQHDYAEWLPNERPYTPQMVVDGHVDQAGFNRDTVRVVIEYCRSHVKPDPTIAVSHSGERIHVDLGAGDAPEERADVWLVAFAPGAHAIEIGAGDNAGRTMVRHNVVHSVRQLGAWDGDAVSLEAETLGDEVPGELGYAVLVQNAGLGRMIATGYVLPE
ncbi:MAG: DUF1223 domain-containing protein [Maricaulaceae bacterium]|jgi:hypothetical protein